MDFATEEKLCRLAHEIWRQIATEPCADQLAVDRTSAGHGSEPGTPACAPLLHDSLSDAERDGLSW